MGRERRVAVDARVGRDDARVAALALAATPIVRNAVDTGAGTAEARYEAALALPLG